MRVLIADDSEFLVQRLAAALTKIGGVEVVGAAGTVLEASEAVRNLKPDVVILDIGMPGGSGIDVLENMKKDHLTPVVIVLTNYGLPQYHRRCMQGGAKFFFDKSTEFEKVSEVLRTLTLSESARAATGNHDAGDPTESAKGPPAGHFGGGLSSSQSGTTMTQEPKRLVSGPSETGPSPTYARAVCNASRMPTIKQGGKR